MSKRQRPHARDNLARRIDDPAASSDVLRRRVVSGLAWKGTTQVVGQGVRLGVAIILARLLLPHDYGVAGILLVLVAFVLVLSDLALGLALVQRRTLSQLDCSTVFWMNIAAGMVFTGAGIAAAGPIASFFREPELTSMVRVLSISFILASIGLTQSSLLVRAMDFRSLELREMASMLASGAAAVVVAALGFGAWAIVAQQLTRSVVSSYLVWRFSSWRPSLAFSISTLRGLAGFSGNVLGQNLVTQLRSTSDNILVGRFLGAAALGAYSLAYNLILVPFNRVALPLSQVLYPALARLQDELDRVEDYWLRSVRTIAAVATPALVGLIIVAPDFVRVVLGEKWSSAVPVVQLLAVVGLLQTLQFLNPAILQALDRTSILFRFTLCSYAATLGAFAIGLQWGIVGLAAAYAVVASITESCYAYLTARAMGSSIARLARALTGVTAASAVMSGLVLAVRLLLVHWHVGAGIRLPVLVALGTAVYIAAAARLSPQAFGEIRSLLRQRRAGPSLEPDRAKTAELLGGASS